MLTASALDPIPSECLQNPPIQKGTDYALLYGGVGSFRCKADALLLSRPEQEILAFPKLSKAYFAFFEVRTASTT